MPLGGVLLLLSSASLAAGQDPLPEGPGKDVTVRMCGTCHPSARGAAVRLTREGWQDVIAKMVSLGAKGTDEELAAVLDYLSTNFKGDAPKPINLNTAPAIDLESVAGLLRKEAAAWIAQRTKTPCKTLDDLKKFMASTSRRSTAAAIASSASSKSAALKVQSYLVIWQGPPRRSRSRCRLPCHSARTGVRRRGRSGTGVVRPAFCRSLTASGISHRSRN